MGNQQPSSQLKLNNTSSSNLQNVVNVNENINNYEANQFLQNILFSNHMCFLSPQQLAFVANICYKIPFIADMPLQIVQKICKGFRKCLGTEQWLLKEGETATYFFILVKGQLQVIKNGCVVKTLEPGDYFGQIAILYGLKRSSSIRTVNHFRSKNVYYALHKKQILQYFPSPKNENIQDLLQILHQNQNKLPFFSYLSRRDKVKLANYAIKIKFNANQMILASYDQPYALYIIKKGKLKLTLSKGRELIIEQGQICGYTGCEQSNLSIASLTETAVYAIGRDYINIVLKRKIKYLYLWNKAKYILTNSILLSNIPVRSIQQITKNLKFIFVPNFSIVCLAQSQITKLYIPINCKQKNIKNKIKIGRKYLQFQSQNQKYLNQKQNMLILGLAELLAGQGTYRSDFVADQQGYYAQIDSYLFMKIIQEQYKPNLYEQFYGFNYKNIQIFQKFQAKSDKNTQKSQQNQQIKTSICKQNRFNLYFILQQCNLYSPQYLNIQSTANILYQLSSYFIQSLYFHTICKQQNKLILCKQLIRGITLRQHILNIGQIPCAVSRFYIACIIVALEYLHKRSIVCHQISMKNCKIDEDGYLWLVNLNMSKIGENRQNRNKIQIGQLKNIQNIQAKEKTKKQIKSYKYCQIQKSQFIKNFNQLGHIVHQLLVGYGAKLSPQQDHKIGLQLQKIKYPMNFKNKQGKQLIQTLLFQKEQIIKWKRIKQLAFFKSIDWKALQNKQKQAPIIPGFMSLNLLKINIIVNQ